MGSVVCQSMALNTCPDISLGYLAMFNDPLIGPVMSRTRFVFVQIVATQAVLMVVARCSSLARLGNPIV